MSWITDDGRHEGYASHVAADGREAVATSIDGLVMGYRQTAEVVPWSSLLGWEARCTCGWRGPLWRRLDADEQDAGEHMLEDGSTAEDAVLTLWEAHAERARHAWVSTTR